MILVLEKKGMKTISWTVSRKSKLIAQLIGLD